LRHDHYPIIQVRNASIRYMTDNTPSETFGRSAFLAHLHSRVPASETQPIIADLLAVLGESDPATAARLASIEMSRLTYFDLVNWSKRIEDHAWRDRISRAAAKFWAAQTLVTTALRPTVFDPNYDYPAAIASALETGAQGLFDVGQSQFDQLAMLGKELVKWLIERKPTRIALIESPIGNTVPTQFLEALAKGQGLSAKIVQWNAPRNDRARLGRTVEDTAAICAAETEAFDLVVLADESLTGTRFLKLFDALIQPIGKDRLVPIAMLFPDVQRPNLGRHENRARLIKVLETQGKYIGYPNCHVTFSGHRWFRIDGGPRAIWQSPVIWGDSEMVAGKRKINLAFMLIDHFRDIIDDLAQTDSMYRPYLERAWALNEHGRAFAFVPGLMQRCFESIGRDLLLEEFRNELWANAKARFPQD
jgi:hypothetical protein